MRSRAKQKLQFEGMFSVDHADLAHIDFFRAHHSPNSCSVVSTITEMSAIGPSLQFVALGTEFAI